MPAPPPPFWMRPPIVRHKRTEDRHDRQHSPNSDQSQPSGAAFAAHHGFVRDDELVTEGRLQQAKAAELSRAAQLEIRVAQERAAADERLQRRLARAEADRVQTESETRQRERELQRDKAQEQRRVRESAKRREARLDRTDQVRQRAVETKERSAAKIRVTQGSAALAERRRALSATKKAQDVDRRLATRRAQRKTR